MKRRLALSAAVVAIIAAALAAAFWSRPPRMVRVGGDSNACACTHRIEP
jgi:flagellar biosynthesis/type III secretory pathway M-ring protein FliF/YscJ